MPLLDHFHPPLSDRRRWEGFHARRASLLRDHLNERLPKDYFSEPQVHAGPRIEVDAATFDDPVDVRVSEPDADGGGTAVLAPPKTIAHADLTLPLFLPPN